MTERPADAAAETLASFAEGAFWRFSLAYYARPGVAPACLRLQDDHGLDVNMVLFCLWAGRRGLRLEGDCLAAIAAEARLWQQQAVTPLRQLRRWLKTQESPEAPKVAALRRAIKELELRAEAVEQERLGRHLPGAGGTADRAVAKANLMAYLRWEEVSWDNGVGSLMDSLAEQITAGIDEP